MIICWSIKNMHNLSIIEQYYQKYIQNLYYWVPEGLYTVDLALLHQHNLLHFQYPESSDPYLTRYFHIIDSSDKITLINEEFIIWIIPDRVDNISVTYTLIAINKDNQPKLEMAFVASGVYNTSKVVLRVLEKFLVEIQENEKTLKSLKINNLDH